MKSFEIKGLKKLGITPRKWGQSFRVKVRNQYGRTTYIGDLSRPSSKKLISRFYKLDLNEVIRFLTYVKPDHRETYRSGDASEWYLYENLSEDEVYSKIRTVLANQTQSFKVHVQLGYTLIEPNGTEYDFYPSSSTNVFSKPAVVNQKSDIETNVMSYIESKDFAESIRNYKNSATKLKEINMVRLIIYYKDHKLGKNIKLPEVISKNRHVIDFPNSEDKCMFYCIAYHLFGGERHRMVKSAKTVVKQYCDFEGIEYSQKVFSSMKPIDILQFDKLEDCFKLNINVFEMDLGNVEVNKIRASTKPYDNTINILDYKSHAMYITDIDKLLSRYCCSKCSMIFKTCDKLRNHKKNMCHIETLESFIKKPQTYRPRDNKIKQMLSKAKIKDVDHYIDHYIVFDFEAILERIDEQHGANSKFTSRHVPVSVSIADSLTNQVKFFVDESPKQLLTDMFQYIESVALKIAEYNFNKFQPMIEYVMKDKGFSAAIKGKSIGVEYSYNDVCAMIKAGEWSSLFDFYTNALSSDYTPLKQIRRLIDQTPLIGFNSGNYDLNLVRKQLFQVLGPDNIISVIKNSGYMCISTRSLKILDISNYLPAGTSYAGYLKTYIGECACQNKITCECGLGKGLFPYEYIDSFRKLNETNLPPKSAFDSSLRNSSISEEDYKRVKWVWRRYDMKSIKDLLEWYNNLDVLPFIKAIAKQRDMYKKFGLDIFTDGVSLPSLAEKVMYQSSYSNLKPIKMRRGTSFSFPKCRFAGYKQQDKDKDREFGLTIEHLNHLLTKQHYSCAYCKCALSTSSASADRIDNEIGHIDNNICISCIECNKERSDTTQRAFRYKKLIEYNAHELVFSIDEEQKEIYGKMKRNIVGGPSIIFNRFAKAGHTTIRDGKMCKKVIGYDANALYLGCIGGDMPCGRLSTIEPYESIVEDIRQDKIFGFLECDIYTPEHLKEYFSEMTPIFKNIEINPDEESVIGKHMYEYNQSKGRKRAKKSKKLIGSYFAEKVLIYTPLLKWYLDHGLLISNMYSFVKASKYQPFKSFADDVSNARRAGDISGGSTLSNEALEADTMKIVGNSAIGRAGMDKSKHKKVKFESNLTKVRSIVELNEFHDVEELDGAYEVTLNKRRIKMNNPIHLSVAVYSLAKLRMLEFYYDCMDKYIDRSDFQYQEMDTDSAYIAFSDDNPFENLIKPEMRAEFEADKHNWFPRDHNAEVAAFDKRTPGLFKGEWSGDAMVSLSSKNYVCYNDGDKSYKKCSAKGVQKNKNASILKPECFESVVKDRVSMSATNKGFRIDRETKSIITYSQMKIGLNYYYDKRIVLADGISTIPLNI